MAHPCLPQLTTEKGRQRTAQSRRLEDSRSRAGCPVVPSRRAQPPFTGLVSASASERVPARPSERPRVPAAPRAGDFHGGRCVSEAPRTLSRRPAGCAPSPKLSARKAAGIAVGLSLLIVVGGYPLWAVCLCLASSVRMADNCHVIQRGMCNWEVLYLVRCAGVAVSVATRIAARTGVPAYERGVFILGVRTCGIRLVGIYYSPAYMRGAIMGGGACTTVCVFCTGVRATVVFTLRFTSGCNIASTYEHYSLSSTSKVLRNAMFFSSSAVHFL